LADALSRHGNVSIRIIVTESAEKFLTGQSSEQPVLDCLRQINGVDGIYRNEDEWATPWKRESSILHIEVSRCTADGFEVNSPDHSYESGRISYWWHHYRPARWQK
jgi:hypothetical protein